MLLALFCTACASLSPKPLPPYYTWMIQYGGKAHGYPMPPTMPEQDKKLGEMVGYQCHSPDDAALIEQYIFELEQRSDK